MSEPIVLYDKYGEAHVMHSPQVAHAMVVAGLLFEQPSAYTYEQAQDTTPQEYTTTTPPLTPDDTQDVPVVPTGRARRKGKGDGGVL